uniref:Putative CMP/dCMP deaminase zinc-binding n=1 Tax=viral metagenome TaxID=1070528 RepID=A0A6M3KY96_9ZZZZ
MVDWNQYFMSIAFLVSSRSKDESTHNGAVIVGIDNEILSTGYNSFPRMLNDDVKERQERPEKYYWFEHSERNAIYNAAMTGIKLKGSRIYVTGVPCCDCARGIIQSGIVEVIMDKKGFEAMEVGWSEHSKRTIQMFKECGIKYRFFEEDIIRKIDGFVRGKEINR